MSWPLSHKGVNGHGLEVGGVNAQDGDCALSAWAEFDLPDANRSHLDIKTLRNKKVLLVAAFNALCCFIPAFSPAFRYF